MTTDNTSYPLNTFPLLSEDVERMLLLRAWKDEIFREALIADPKGVIQRLFPQCFPNGKVPEQLTIKVIEEDPYTHHIVVPSLPDEFPTPEIPEEEQLELFANMGSDRMLGKMDSSERRESQSSEKPKHDFTKEAYKRKPEENLTRKQETASELSTTDKFKKEVQQLFLKDEEFRNAVQKNTNQALQEYFPHYFPGSNVSEGHTFKVTKDTVDTHHIVLSKLPDASHDPAVPAKDVQQRDPRTHFLCCVFSRRTNTLC